MRKKILSILFVMTAAVGYAQAQSAERPKGIPRDSVVMESTIYYSKNQGAWIERAYYKNIGRFLKWTQTDTATPIVIIGWTDESGTEAFNRELSLRRAQTIRNYLVGKGIDAERISFKGRGVDAEATSDDKARRADVRGVIRLVAEPQPGEPTETETAKPTEEIAQAAEKQPEKVVVAETLQQPEQTVVANEKVEQPTTKQQPVIEQPATQTAPAKIKSANLRWYAGIELGLPVGISTFTAFEPKGGAGFEGGVLGGYRFSPLLSAEFSAMFGTMKLGASNCCSDYWLGADGMRYLERVAGMDSYSYKDVYSSVFVQQYALRLNVDMLQICNPDWQKRWSLTVSPAIYGIGTKATIKTDNTTIIKRDGRFQFGAGVGIGGGYQITENLGVGLRTGMVWVFGERYDGIAPTDHKENMIWNNTLTLTWRFGCNK